VIEPTVAVPEVMEEKTVETVQSGSVGKQSGLRVSPGAYLGAAWAVLIFRREIRMKLKRRILVAVFIGK
jgi:hypothetical protein